MMKLNINNRSSMGFLGGFVQLLNGFSKMLRGQLHWCWLLIARGFRQVRQL